MKTRTYLLLFAMLANAGAFAAGEVVLPETLGVGWINAPDALSRVAYCVPDITPEKLEDLRGRAAKATVVQFMKNSDKTPYLIASGDRFACIDRSGSGKPLLPARIFAKMLRLDGATEQGVLTLYQSLARQLAMRGAADALVRFANGNAIELTVSVVDDAPAEFLYATNFLKSGEYDESKYRFVLAEPVRSYSTTSYGSAGRRAVAILQDELAPRPLKGEFLLIAGTVQTGEFHFADTRWRFPGGGTIRLAAGGELNFTPKSGEEKIGSWAVDNGALYFNYGKVYGSAVLDKDNALSVEFRNPFAEPDKKERRWTATLEKSRF
ncbi:MAG: hypothetical protein ACM3X0_13940 [Bacteroidota bacterium]